MRSGKATPPQKVTIAAHGPSNLKTLQSKKVHDFYFVKNE
jgi:hypothetical protein